MINKIQEQVKEILGEPKYQHLTEDEIYGELVKIIQKEEGSEMTGLFKKIDQKMSFILSLLAGKPKNGLTVTEEELEAYKEENRRLELELEKERNTLMAGYDEIIRISEDNLMLLTAEAIVDQVLVKKGFYDGIADEKGIEMLENEKYTERNIFNMLDHPEELRVYLERELEPLQGEVTMEEVQEEIQFALRHR